MITSRPSNKTPRTVYPSQAVVCLAQIEITMLQIAALSLLKIRGDGLNP